MISGLCARPSSRSLRAAMNMVGVLPVPTGYGHSAAGEEMIRCTMSRWCGYGAKPSAMPGKVRCAPL